MKTKEQKLRETLREKKQLKIAHQILGDYAQASINDANIKQLIKELTPVADPVTLSIQTQKFVEKLRREIEELGDDTDEIVRMLYYYKYDFEAQIEDTHNNSKILVDKYEKKLLAELDEKTIGLDENDEDDYDTIHQLGLEVGDKVEGMKYDEVERLNKLNKTREEKIGELEEMLDYYNNLDYED